MFYLDRFESMALGRLCSLFCIIKNRLMWESAGAIYHACTECIIIKYFYAHNVLLARHRNTQTTGNQFLKIEIQWRSYTESDGLMYD